MLLPSLAQCLNSPKKILLSETQRSWTASCTYRAVPVCSSSMRTLPETVEQMILFSAAERIKTTCTQASTQRPSTTKVKRPHFVHFQSGHSAAFIYGFCSKRS